MIQKIVFLLALAAVASGYASPPFALALGLLFGLTLAHPFLKESSRISRYLLQASVVGLGFSMNLGEVEHAGRSGFVYTLLGIAFALIVGMALGALLRVERVAAFLISSGTAICGGSAIAAVGPICQATDEQMAVALGTVFALNAIALFIFPPIGAALQLTQTQFGLWAGLAIHDTSSVVGAASQYGLVALTVGTTVKLARALWIVPLALGTALVRRSRKETSKAGVEMSRVKIKWPWFILLFCLAAVCNTYISAGAPVYRFLSHMARIGFAVTLYLIGSGISVATLKQVGPRPLFQGVLLWLLVSAGSLWMIRVGWIAL